MQKSIFIKFIHKMKKHSLYLNLRDMINSSKMSSSIIYTIFFLEQTNELLEPDLLNIHAVRICSTNWKTNIATFTFYLIIDRSISLSNYLLKLTTCILNIFKCLTQYTELFFLGRTPAYIVCFTHVFIFWSKKKSI